MDTKYKSADRIRAADVAQVVAYAEMKGATEAVLLYPESLPKPITAIVGSIRVRTLPFSLVDNLDASGNSVLDVLISEFASMRERHP